MIAPTSLHAYNLILPRTVLLRERILDALRLMPMTDEQLQGALSLEGNVERPRRVELVKMGQVVASGETRPTRASRPAIVWRIK